MKVYDKQQFVDEIIELYIRTAFNTIWVSSSYSKTGKPVKIAEYMKLCEEMLKDTRVNDDKIISSISSKPCPIDVLLRK